MDAGFLTKKVILILSPQSWGNMLLAKHHYAIELAKRGNEVYFLSPPVNDGWHWNINAKRISINQSTSHPNLFLIHQRLFFPYNLKFHSRKLYNLLVKKQIRYLLDAIPKKIDLLWSFDLGNHFPLALFEKKYFKIFHPVDEPGDSEGIRVGSGADILFSVTKEIGEKYKSFDIPSYFINHGLADDFIFEQKIEHLPDGKIHIGISGNLLRPDLDRKTLLQIIGDSRDLIFHFFGSYFAGQSNLAASINKDAEEFVEILKGFQNVVLHGVLKTGDLAKELNKMDAFLICYDIQLDQSKGTNYHKVMEYLSTGKVIISNNITTYSGYPELIRMTAERTDNKMLPELFRETIKNLEKWNADDLVDQRKSFAGNNTYQKQIERIDNYIMDLLKSHSYQSNKTLTPES